MKREVEVMAEVKTRRRRLLVKFKKISSFKMPWL